MNPLSVITQDVSYMADLIHNGPLAATLYFATVLVCILALCKTRYRFVAKYVREITAETLRIEDLQRSTDLAEQRAAAEDKAYAASVQKKKAESKKEILAIRRSHQNKRDTIVAKKQKGPIGIPSGMKPRST